MRKQYSTLDIVKVLGIPRERLRDWMTRGFINPSIQEAKGQGTKALFSLEDVYAIRLFSRLLEIGINRDEASRIITAIELRMYEKANYVLCRYVDDPQLASSLGYDMQNSALKKRPYLVFGFTKTLDGLDPATALPLHVNTSASPKELILFPLQFFKHSLESFKTLFKGHDWDHLFIINLKKIKAEVNGALSGLEE